MQLYLNNYLPFIVLTYAKLHCQILEIKKKQWFLDL